MDDETANRGLRIAENNAGSIRAVRELYDYFGLSDWDKLEELGITGAEIWFLYEDICHQNIFQMHVFIHSGEAIERLRGNRYSAFYEPNHDHQSQTELEGTQKVNCECESFNCGKSIELPKSVALEILRSGNYVIVDGCTHGPSPQDVLVEKRDGYSLYRET